MKTLKIIGLLAIALTLIGSPLLARGGGGMAPREDFQHYDANYGRYPNNGDMRYYDQNHPYEAGYYRGAQEGAAVNGAANPYYVPPSQPSVIINAPQ